MPFHRPQKVNIISTLCGLLRGCSLKPASPVLPASTLIVFFLESLRGNVAGKADITQRNCMPGIPPPIGGKGRVWGVVGEPGGWAMSLLLLQTGFNLNPALLHSVAQVT